MEKHERKSGKCWICGNDAETSEHVIKQTDIAKFFRSAKGEKQLEVKLLNGSAIHKLQSPKSKYVKYPKNLCSHCNNTFTQPFDLAYDEFTRWYDSNRKSVDKQRVIDFKEVYGDQWFEKQLNLFRYFVKEFGCRLTYENIPVPSDLIESLNKDRFLTAFYVSFLWNYDLAMMNAAAPILISLPLTKKEIGNDEIGYFSGRTYDCLSILYHYGTYNPVSENHIGAPWAGNSRCVYLGWHFQQDKDKKKHLIDTVLSMPEMKIVSPSL